MSNRRAIPNPSGVSPTLTPEEKKFLQGAEADKLPIATTGKAKAKGRQFSMTDEFYADLHKFLEEFPNEGSKSSLVVRVVGEYMRKKRAEYKS